ncbi:MAG: cbb3-type cytochrome c oxidase subunit I [Rickettsiales bacterium]|nr:cbb3-type cytochrome c oxidase subunit I [Rickettsiales bacterium]
MSNSAHSLFPAFSEISDEQKDQAKHWLKLALLSVALSGIAPLVLLAGRASLYAEMASVKQWFVPVLVIHVNLSVGLWFLAMTMMLWRIVLPAKLPPLWHGASAISFCLGIVMMVLAPFAGGEAFTSNYIPVQNNPIFFFGLSLILASLLLMLGVYLWALLRQTKQSFVQGLISCNVLVLLTVIACFSFSVIQHPDGYGGEGYYESIFWAGGHILQFVYVQIAMIAWLWLAQRLELALPKENLLKAAFGLLTVTACLSPLVFLFVDVNSYYHIKFFSWQMNVVTGTVPGLLAAYLLFKLVKAPKRPAIFWVLLMSLILFLSGGFVGFLIEGSSTVIPAHYHGSTVGVTLALMGVAYLLLPALGGKQVAQWKMAKLQPVLYGIGQLLHVIGFAIAGSEGAGRKMAGSMEGATELAQAGMQLVRLGGILAVIGGGLFVVVMLRAWRAVPAQTD